MNELVKKLLIAQDKANHFIYSLLLSLVFFILLSIANEKTDLMILAFTAGMISFAIGINKERVDYYSGKGTASWLDLLADLLGICTFVFIVYLVNVLK